MTTMLICVHDAEDAALALAWGADRLGLRLDAESGASDQARLETVVSRIDRRCPISLFVGDQFDTSAILRTLTLTGADELRLPLGRLSVVTSRVPKVVRVVGVVGVGQLSESMTDADRAQCHGLMVTTEGVSERLLAQGSIADLSRIAVYCRTHNLALSLAGGLEPPDVPRLMPLRPAELCFDAGTDPARLRLLRDLISGTQIAPLAEPSLPPAPLDRIFLRDWIVPVRIGAYVHERAAPQRVRFNVEADLARQTHAAADMRDVVSYDLITDGIRRLTVDHVDLVETLAEGIAAAVLGHPRVVRVTVTVEKLDLGPGALGCQITRDKAS